MTSDQSLRQELVHLLVKRQAHADFGDAVADLGAHANMVPPGCPYSFWQVLEHLRICQRDILDYIVADDYQEPSFPDDLWPDAAAQANAATWQTSVDAFVAERRALVDIIQDPATDLFAPLPNSGERGHTVLREIHVVASHNAYHTGELVVMRRSLGLW